ncbi:hypothetical protein JKP88DRAFT_286392 [Tribonema minus]|uniref:Laminin EGF-like domain-containing protein n=1 Tax=Tribonema minus TaxID=303371 RepID=A0A835ZAA8_9STRA|nr:hypothetical protein JKP88DRAFT_286392 [Tribonema minus]
MRSVAWLLPLLLASQASGAEEQRELAKKAAAKPALAVKCDDVCLPGFGGKDCKRCEGETYSPGDSLQDCQRCLPGYRISDKKDACQDCKPGYGDPRTPWGSDVAYTSRVLTDDAAPQCEPCREGSISSGGYFAECKWCDAGFLSSADRTQCRGCKPGYGSPLTDCPGYGSPLTDCVECKGKVCSPCTGNSVATGGIGSQCTQCPAGYIANDENTACSDCAAGHGGEDCHTCAGNTYSPGPHPSEPAFGECKVCATGYQPNALHSDCKDCAPGYGKNDKGDACVACTANNQYSPGGPSAICKPCPPGLQATANHDDCGEHNCAPGKGGAWCEDCPAGTYSPGGVGAQCIACPEGSFSYAPAAAMCKACPDGETSDATRTACVCLGGYGDPAETGDQIKRCGKCDRGYYSVGGARDECAACGEGATTNRDRTACDAVARDTCAACGEGVTANRDRIVCDFCLPGYGGPHCDKCPAGTFSAGGAGAVCGTCPLGTVARDAGAARCAACPYGEAPSSDQTQCVCKSGFGNPYEGPAPQVDKCEACNEGEIGDGGDMAPCDKCKAGTTSNSDHTACDVCLPGYGGKNCDLCPAGTYSPGGKRSCCGGKGPKCEICPVGFITSKAGSSVCAVCQAGYGDPAADNPQEDERKCYHCDKMAYSLGGTRTPCVLCDNSTSNSERTKCEDFNKCYRCDKMAYSLGGTRTPCVLCDNSTSTGERTKCEVCLPGYGGPGCGECLAGSRLGAWAPICFPGYGGAGRGECPAGTFSPGGCPAGTFSAGGVGAECQQCSAGTYADSTGNTVCQACPVTETSAPDRQSCVCLPGYGSCGESKRCEKCERGAYSRGGDRASCARCPGNFAPNADHTICNACKPGYAGPNCDACPAGTHSAGGVNATCEPCGDGFVSSAGQDTCTACPRGETSNFGNTHCVCKAGHGVGAWGGKCGPCDKYSYSAGGAREQCASCGNATSNADRTACEVCKPGYGGPACDQCPAGTYSLGGVGADCERCNEGTYSSAGSAKCTACKSNEASNAARDACVCKPGYMDVDPSATKTNCVKCACDKFSWGGDGAACQPCADGTVADEDRTACNICKPGYGGRDCALCPKGMYSAGGKRSCCGGGGPKCDICPDSFVALAEGSSICTVCAPGYAYQGGACKQCSADQYSLGGPKTEQCHACPASTESNPERTECNVCKPGFGGEGCGVCPDGHSSDGGKGVQCMPCPAGAVSRVGIASDGTVTAPVCTVCPKGQAPNEDQTECVCAPGYGLQLSEGHAPPAYPLLTGDGANAECVRCAGNAISAGGLSECLQCPEYSECDSCGLLGPAYPEVRSWWSRQQGSAAAGGGFGAAAGGEGGVVPPPRVRFAWAPNKSHTQCNVCQPGYGGKDCAICPAGTWSRYSTGQGCRPCPEGMISDEGAQECRACEDESLTADEQHRTCVCAPGHGGRSCKECLAANFKFGYGGSFAECEVCPDTAKYGIVVRSKHTHAGLDAAVDVGIGCNECDHADSYRDPNNLCQACGINKTRDPQDDSQCVCKSGFTDNGAGTCVCTSPTQYVVGTECKDLPDPAKQTATFQGDAYLCVDEHEILDANGKCVKCPFNQLANSDDTHCGLCLGPLVLDAKGERCVCPDLDHYFDPNDGTTGMCKECVGDRLVPNVEDDTCVCKAALTADGDRCVCLESTYYDSAEDKCKACADPDRQVVDDDNDGCECNAALDLVYDATDKKCVCKDDTKFWDAMSKTCTACAARKEPAAGNEHCECEDMFIVDPNASTKCICPAGKVLHEGACVACADAKRESNAANDACVCKAGFKEEGGICVCATAGNYWDGDSCEACPDRKKPAADNNSCECQDKFVLLDGKCVCPDGKYLGADGVCAACPARKVSNDANDGCVCASIFDEASASCACPDGKVLVQSGQSSTCEACTDPKKESNATNDACKCKAAFLDADAKGLCVCKDGKFWDQTSCEACPARKEPTADNEDCLCQNATEYFNSKECLACTACVGQLTKGGANNVCGCHGANEIRVGNGCATCNPGMEPNSTGDACVCTATQVDKAATNVLFSQADSTSVTAAALTAPQADARACCSACGNLYAAGQSCVGWGFKTADGTCTIFAVSSDVTDAPDASAACPRGKRRMGLCNGDGQVIGNGPCHPPVVAASRRQ